MDSTRSAYKIIKYSPEYKQSIIEFQSFLWGKNQSLNAAYWDWKYEQNPYQPYPVVYLSLYEGQGVGMLGLFGSKWEFGNPPRRFTLLCLSDFVEAPEHRGLRHIVYLYQQVLNDLLKDGYTYCLTLSGNEISTRLALKTGWHSISHVELMVRNKNQQRMIQKAKRYLQKIPIFYSHNTHPFSKLDRFLGKHDNSKIFVDQHPRLAEMAELVERIGYDGRMRHVRDREYFAYRYLNPLSRYRFLYYGEDLLEGYLVLQTSISAGAENPWANIVDWEAINDEVFSDLLKSAIQLGDFNRLSIWSVTLPESMRKVLDGNGFTPATQDVDVQGKHVSRVLIKFLEEGKSFKDKKTEEFSPEQSALIDVNNWDLRGIYSEGF